MVSPPSIDYMHLDIPEGKKGARNVYESIPKAIEFIRRGLLKQNGNVLICCKEGILVYPSIHPSIYK
jgi:protein-tyrosine phosphatase